MYEEIREKAVVKLENKKAQRKGVRTVGVVFGAVSAVLYVISTQMSGDAVFWTRFPIIIFAIIFAMIYISTFGFPFFEDTDELSDEEIEREMVNIYRKSNLNKLTEDDNFDALELKEIEIIKAKMEKGDEFV